MARITAFSHAGSVAAGLQLCIGHPVVKSALYGRPSQVGPSCAGRLGFLAGSPNLLRPSIRAWAAHGLGSRGSPHTSGGVDPSGARAAVDQSAAMATSTDAPDVSVLFQPLSAGAVELKHRIALSAMTRLRMNPATDDPTDLTVLYYAQRASEGGLLVSEGMAPSPGGVGYIRSPSLFSSSSVQAWHKVTDAVHSKGGYIFAQLMHVGRVTHPSLLPPGKPPVAPSAIKMEGLVQTRAGKAPYETPEAVSESDIPTLIDEIVTAAKNARDAGFDGVELHGGNGFLIQQFLAQKTNQRTDKYGGSLENRARFVLELIDATAAAIGSDRVGIKLQPGVTFSDLTEPEDDVLAQLHYLGPELENRKLAYVNLSSLNYEPYFRFIGLDKPNVEADVWQFFRKHYKGTLMINGGLDPVRAATYVGEGTADLVSFGVLFLANANLPALIKAGRELRGADMKTWYGGDPAFDAQGYVDWPLVET